MGKTWVLDTDTKGTGARMVPLEEIERKPAEREGWRPPRPAPRQRPTSEAEPEPPPPRRFRVLDAVSRALLADDADVRTTIDVLRGMRSSVDVSVYVWERVGERWRLLPPEEKKIVWELRDRQPARRRPSRCGRSTSKNRSE